MWFNRRDVSTLLNKICYLNGDLQCAFLCLAFSLNSVLKAFLISRWREASFVTTHKPFLELIWKGKNLKCISLFVVSFIEFRSLTLHFFCKVRGGWFLGRYPKTMRTRELFSKSIGFENFKISSKGTCSSVARKTVYRLIKLGTTLKIKKICLSSKVSIQPCRPKSDSAVPGAIWAQFRPKKLNQKAIPAHRG